MADLGIDGNDIALFPLHKMGYGSLEGEDGVGDGVMFCTYSSLIAGNKDGKRRVDQLISWASDGGDPDAFEGVIAFDECHKAKHAATDGKLKPTKTGEAVIEIQRRLPKARVLYVSATAASEVKDLCYMERLGLWGAHSTAPFASFQSFQAEMTRGGIAAMELLAMDLKARGLLVSRMLAFAGCTFEVTTAKLTAEQRLVYDQAVNIWEGVLKLFEDAAAEAPCSNAIGSGGSSTPMMANKHVWASHQQFFRQLLNSLKAEAVIHETTEALDKGYSVVLGLISTGAARGADAESRSLAAANGDASAAIVEAVSAPSEILRALLEKHLSVAPQSPLAMRQRALLQELEALPLPLTALDIVVNHFGTEAVAEMTGRKKRLIFGDDGSARWETRAKQNVPLDQINLHERAAFLNGEKRIAIISEVASAGISLHADKAFPNVQPRMHITMELAWSAEKQLQQFGRTHRARQAQAPHYKLLVSDVGGEARFAATIAKRLSVLGAITRGDRRGASGASFARFDFDTTYGHRALDLLYMTCVDGAREHKLWNEDLRGILERGPGGSRGRPRVLKLQEWATMALARSSESLPSIRERLGEANQQHLRFVHGLRDWVSKARASHSASRIGAVTRLLPVSATGPLRTVRFFDRAARWLAQMRLIESPTSYMPDGPDRKNVNKFLNRVLGLPVEAQREMVNVYAGLLGQLRGYERARGVTQEDGPQNLTGEHIRSRNGPEGEVVFVDEVSGARTVLYQLEVDTGVSWANVSRRHQELLSSTLGPVAEPKKKGLPEMGFYKQRRSGRVAHAAQAAAAANSGLKASKVYRLTRPYTVKRTLKGKETKNAKAGQHIHANELKVTRPHHAPAVAEELTAACIRRRRTNGFPSSPPKRRCSGSTSMSLTGRIACRSADGGHSRGRRGTRPAANLPPPLRRARVPVPLPLSRSCGS